MRLLDRYIARQVFVSSMFAVAVIIIILVLGNVFKEILRELAKRPDLDLFFVFKFIGLVIPFSLGIAIPFSFLTAILLTFGRLSADSEFISMRMAGLNMWRICLPVAVLALFFTSICTFVNLSVTPWAKTELEGMKASLINLIKREPMLLFPDGQVMSELPGHLVYANKEEGILTEFQMIKMEGDLPHILAIAESASVDVDMEREEPEMALTMKNVNLVTKGGDGDFLSSSHPFFMEEATVGVSLSQFSAGVAEVKDQPENVGLGRLLQLIADPDLEPSMHATYRTELSMRMALSVSCITFGLIGVPLGINAQRRESTAGFGLSLIIALTYYALLNFAQQQRTNEAAYPHLLIWIPNILFISLGVYLFFRLSRR